MKLERTRTPWDSPSTYGSRSSTTRSRPFHGPSLAIIGPERPEIRAHPELLQKLYDQRALGVCCSLRSYMLDAATPVGAQEVESKTVIFIVDSVDESGLQCSPLCGIDQALKYGVLNAMSVSLADSGNVAKPALPALVLCYIVAYKHHHVSLLFNLRRTGCAKQVISR